MAVKKIRSSISRANQFAKKVARDVNRYDAMYGGRLLNNPLAGTIVPYANMAATAVDYFDELLPISSVEHPQINSGQVAGVSQTRPVRRTAPRVTSSKGTITVMHKEYLGDIATLSTGAVVTSPTYSSGESVLSLNPTNPSMFPWLCNIARNYDYFRFKRVRVVYVPLCSTATVGRVMLAHDPDGTDVVPYNRPALSSYECSVDSSCWGITSLDCKLPNNQPWYQTNTPTTQAMFSTSTQGSIIWATWAGTAAASVGEAYVLYEVELKSPQPGFNPVSSATSTGGNVVANFPLYSGAIQVADVATDLKVLFLATGTYRVEFYAATTAATAGITVTSGGNITVLFSGKVADGTNARAYAIVNVTGTGMFDAAGHAVSTFAFVQCNNLTALGAATINVEIIATPVTYP
jgi:hypothetical protein